MEWVAADIFHRFEVRKNHFQCGNMVVFCRVAYVLPIKITPIAFRVILGNVFNFFCFRKILFHVSAELPQACKVYFSAVFLRPDFTRSTKQLPQCCAINGVRGFVFYFLLQRFDYQLSGKIISESGFYGFYHLNSFLFFSDGKAGCSPIPGFVDVKVVVPVVAP